MNTLTKEAKVDVLIPTYKPGNMFGNIIKRLIKQTVDINRIIVINTEEAYWDHEYEDLTDKLEVHHISKADFGHGSSRNALASYSDADVIVYLTQDAKPFNQFLIERLIAPLSKDDKVFCSYGRQLARGDAIEIEKFTRAYNYPHSSSVKSAADLERYGIKTYFCSNSCAAYLREEFENLGGFDTECNFGEDTILAAEIIKAGGNIAYCADAIVYHSHNYTIMQQFRRNFDIGVMHADFLSRYDLSLIHI